MLAEADPNLIVYFGGAYVPLREARVGILTHALHYGTGVFEGIRGYWNDTEQQLFLVRPLDHYQRWKQNCAILRIHVPPSAGELTRITAELVRRNSFRTDIYVRPLAYKSAQRVGVATDDQDAFAVIALPFGEYLHCDKDCTRGSAPGGGSKTTRFLPEPRSAEPMSTAPWPRTMPGARASMRHCC